MRRTTILDAARNLIELLPAGSLNQFDRCYAQLADDGVTVTVHLRDRRAASVCVSYQLPQVMLPDEFDAQSTQKLFIGIVRSQIIKDPA